MRKILLVGLVLGFSSSAFALPFNTDMVNVQPRTGAIMREKADGSIPVGFVDRRIATKADAERLQNPVKSDANSTMMGERLFQVNCLPCHGDISKSPRTVGLVGAKLSKMPPDIGTGDYKGRTDGSLYGTIELGFGIMPPVGWKLSPTEHWDIINYIRKVQQTR